MLLHDAFDFHARGRGDNCFAQCEGKSFSYRAARSISLKLAQALIRAGVAAGDRICLLQRNSIEGLLLIFAASRIGAVIVPLNYRLAPREWIDLTADATASVFFADPEYAQRLDAAFAEYPLSQEIVKISMAGGIPGWKSFEEFAEISEPFFEVTAPSESAIIFQMYTSGTTGKPKGALLSHNALMENVCKGVFAAPYRLNPGERTLVVLPLFHIASICGTFCSIVVGAHLVIHRDVDPAAIFKALIQDEIVTLTLVPAVIQAIVSNIPDIENFTFPKLRALGYGASPIAPPVLRKAMEVFKCDIYQGFGMTEIGGVGTLLTEADHRRALESEPELLVSAGQAIPGMEIKIVLPDGQPAKPGEIGEILLRGSCREFLSGYWQMPEASAATLADGWLHTGDAGYLDKNGYLYVRDRIKDMIVSGAENIYPAEIESVLFDHQAVADVSVIGVPDDRWGETVMAVIVLKNGEQADIDDLDRLCRSRLGGFKVPRRYEFIASLPRNAAGKVLKKDLRKQYWKGQSREIA
ncbi:MAG: long-chain-fatty-acid--CoA ligase [Sphingomonadaceae bacterium]